MDSVVFDGKEYVKASVLAQKFRYTADYLGQLCRGKKVDARLVGRAWYLNLDSLEEHRTGRYKAPAKAVEISLKKSPSNYLSRIDVEPVLKNKTVKIFKQKSGVLTEFPVRYEQDEYSLIPRINKSAVNTSIPILPAEAERLKIKKEPKKFNITDFKAEALPEVFLSGAIRVDGIPEAMESVEATVIASESADITKEIKTELDTKTSPKRLISVRQPMKKLLMGTRVDMRPVVSAKIEEIAPRSPVVSQKVLVRVSKSKISSKAPVEIHSAPVPVLKQIDTVIPKQSKVAIGEIKFSPDVVVPKRMAQKASSGISDTVLALAVFLCATIVSLTVLLTNREVLVDGGSYVDNLSFDTANLTAFLSSFLR